MPKKLPKKSQLVPRIERPLVLRGIILSILGLAAIIAPTYTLGFIVWIFGFITLAETVPLFMMAIRLNVLSLFVDGVITLILGIAILFRADIAVQTIYILLSIRMVLSGIAGIHVGYQLEKIFPQGNLMLAWSAFAILGGIGMLLYPFAGIAFIAFVTGALVLISAAILFVLALNVHKLHAK